MPNDDVHWVGLTNPKRVTCKAANCHGQLRWVDGSDFQYQTWMGPDFPDFSQGKNCLTIAKPNAFEDYECDLDSSTVGRGICQYDCSGEGEI